MTRSSKSSPKPKPNSAKLSAQFRFEGIGTSWLVDIFNPEPGRDYDVVIAELRTRMDEFDQHYSRFRADSLITAISKQPGAYKLPADAQPMLDLYRELYRLTDGAMTPMVGNLLAEAGYDAEYSLKPGKLHPPLSWAEALGYNFPELIIKKPVLLDFGAIGKGYLIDMMAEILQSKGVKAFTINGGGDILHRGGGIKIALEDSTDSDQAIGVATIANQSLCGSAGNRRRWGEFHHIMNPHTLTSPHHIQAVWAVAKTTMLADAMTTALFFAEPEKLRQTYQFEYAFINEDNSLSHSPNFPAEFFTA